MNNLKNKWVFWFHNPKDNNWTLESYKEIYKISTIEEFWNLYKNIDSNIIQDGMFFLMKENVKPLWEMEENINGGCWSYKINKREVCNAWSELSIAVCSENLLKNNSLDLINGISISPKKSFCILKIWNNDNKQCSKDLISKKVPNLFVSQCIYKSHNLR